MFEEGVPLVAPPLVDGLPTYAHAVAGKHDLELMKRCCVAELEHVESLGLLPAPFYFERVMVLARKAKDPATGEHFRKLYVEALDRFAAATPELAYMAEAIRPRFLPRPGK